MKKTVKAISVSFLLVSVVSGCASSGHRSTITQPQRNVATGTIIGAGLGAIIGNQIGSGHPATGAVIGGLLGGSTGAVMSRPYR